MKKAQVYQKKLEERRSHRAIRGAPTRVPVLPKHLLHDPFALQSDDLRRMHATCQRCTAQYYQNGKRMPKGSAFLRPPTVAPGARCIVCNYPQHGRQGDDIRMLAQHMIQFDLFNSTKSAFKNFSMFDPMLLGMSQPQSTEAVAIKLTIWEAARTCPQCQMLFKSTTELARHMYTRHDVDPNTIRIPGFDP